MEKPTASKRKLINGCALIVIALSLIIVLAVSLRGSNAPEEADIKKAARFYIIHNLKDPNADFFHDGTITKQGDSIFIYKEGFKATNGLGLKIPSEGVVKLKWNGNDPSDSDAWDLLDINITSR